MNKLLTKIKQHVMKPKSTIGLMRTSLFSLLADLPPKKVDQPSLSPTDSVELQSVAFNVR